jgi:lipid-A-disaccharide synthase
MNPKKILIVSGEPSGDLHASKLVENLKRLDPGLKFFGLGCSFSKKAGVDVIFDMSELAIIGLTEVFRNIFKIGAVRKKVLDRITADRPDIAILVDYPGFNLRLARELKKRSIPVIYYISPQIWAWGMDRINIIKACVAKMVVFFKFEEDLYQRHGVNAEFVGHPLLETVKATASKDEVMSRYGLSPDRTTIALLPGSRKTEIVRILPAMASSCAFIRKEIPDAQFIIAKHRDLPAGLYQKAVERTGLDIKIAEGDTHNVVKSADFAIVTSGTATLETAILGTPFLVVYKSSVLTEIAYYAVRTVEFIALANIIAGGQIVPELLQNAASPERIARTALGIIRDKQAKAHMLDELKRVSLSLGTPGASERAAKAMLPYLK